jgi:20S proteasome subunit beta 5
VIDTLWHAGIMSNKNTRQLANDLQYHGTTTIAFVYRDSVIVAVDSKASIGDYVGSRTVRKVLPITDHMVATMAGGAADCTHILRRLATECKQIAFHLSDMELTVGMTAK